MKKIILVVAVLAVLQWWYKDPSISVPSTDVSFGYIIKYSGEGKKNDNLPMLVALHGDGDTVKNFYNTALNEIKMPARIVLIKGPLSRGGGNAWPWKVEQYNQYGKAFNEAVRLLAQKYRTIGDPVLMGFSGGAAMAFYQSLLYGESYSYVIPVSGRLKKELLVDKTIEPNTRVFSFHGKNDTVISISGGREAVNLLRENGSVARLFEFDGNHHGIFTNMKSEITQFIERKLVSLK